MRKKFDNDDPTPGSIGLVLRSGNANSSVADYNKDAMFEFGYYNGKDNYQIYDGSGAEKADSGVPFTDSGVSVTVTITGPDTYDLEIQTLKRQKSDQVARAKIVEAAEPIRKLRHLRSQRREDTMLLQPVSGRAGDEVSRSD